MTIRNRVEYAFLTLENPVDDVVTTRIMRCPLIAFMAEHSLKCFAKVSGVSAKVN